MTASEGEAIQRVGVVGCGLMGSGIAQVSAMAGYDVHVVEADPAALDSGMKRIERSLEKLVEKEKISAEQRDAAKGRLHPSTSLDDLKDCDLVVEAIIEDLAQKKALFEKLGQITGPSAILATNTSSFPVGELGDPAGRPDRVIGLHFFNPVQLMKLVEVVKTAQTDAGALAAANAYAVAVGKTPIQAADTPGFVVNRLLVPYLGEAIRMLERGDATMEDIDTGMALGCGHPMGPITLLDYVGLDTTLFIMQGWHERYPENPLFEPPQLLRQLVSEGRLGRKSGHGFYAWEGDKRK